MGLDISILFRVHTRVFSQFSTERRHVIRKTHLLATLSINRGIPPPVDGPFHQTCHCGEVRGKKNVQTCAEQGDSMIRLTPYDRSWRTVGSILLVGTIILAAALFHSLR